MVITALLIIEKKMIAKREKKTHLRNYLTSETEQDG